MESTENVFHILFVEDDEVDIENVQREIKKMATPIKLHIAHNGIEALDKLYGRNGQEKLKPTPRLILLDINMPKMNGIEFLEKLCSDPQYKLMPVYILTSAFTSRDKIAFQHLGVAGCIVKPDRRIIFSLI